MNDTGFICLERWRRPEKKMVNKEAAPLLLGVSIPILLLGLLVIQLYKFDIFSVLQAIDPIYYIVLFPIILGIIMGFLIRGK
jgi:hypothetical protein